MIWIRQELFRSRDYYLPNSGREYCNLERVIVILIINDIVVRVIINFFLIIIVVVIILRCRPKSPFQWYTGPSKCLGGVADLGICPHLPWLAPHLSCSHGSDIGNRHLTSN